MRNDIHSPKNLVPKDYEFVAFSGFKEEEYLVPDWVLAQRETLRQHMIKTGGKFSSHEHGGSCHVCGNVNAIYMVVFYHRPTNSYIRVGRECADKIDEQAALGLDKYSQNVRGERLRRNRLEEAKAWLLSDESLAPAWKIYETLKKGEDTDRTYHKNVLFDIVTQLIAHGTLSERQIAYLKRLVSVILTPKKVEEEKPKSSLTAGRQQVEGEVIGIKVDEVWRTTKALIKLDSGHKIWGTFPATVERFEDGSEATVYPAKGIRIKFTATIKLTNDPSFAVFSHPRNSELVRGS